MKRQRFVVEIATGNLLALQCFVCAESNFKVFVCGTTVMFAVHCLCLFHIFAAIVCVSITFCTSTILLSDLSAYAAVVG